MEDITGTMKKGMIFKFFIMIVFISGLPVSYILGDYKNTYYPSPGLITVELEEEIVTYLDCERASLDYPEMTSWGKVNIGLDKKGNIRAAIEGAPIGIMKREFTVACLFPKMKGKPSL